MTDMSSVIVPRSDQVNADDFFSGPCTYTIEGVAISPGTEQPVSIRLRGEDRVWRPCKSMSRVLVYAWGPDAKAYTGRSLTLYRDPDVTWAGMKVGGIRISHMSDIERDHTMALTVTKQSRKPYTVKPLRTNAPAPSAPPTPPAEQSLAEQLDHLEPDEWKQSNGEPDDRQAEMLPAREWTPEAVEERGKVIAAALRDHGDKIQNLDTMWQLHSAEIMTMPVPAQRRLRKSFDVEFEKLSGAS